MDIKSKRRSRLETLIVTVVLLVTVFGVTVLFPSIHRRARENTREFYERPGFDEHMYECGYVLYWRTEQRMREDDYGTAYVFFPEYMEELEQKARGGEGDGEAWQELETLAYGSRNVLNQWNQSFSTFWEPLEYIMVDTDGNITGTGSEDLVGLAKQGDSDRLRQRLENAYAYYAVIRYDKNGDISIGDVYGADRSTLTSLEEGDRLRHFRERFQELSGSALSYQAASRMRVPRDMTIVYAVPQANYGRDRTPAWYDVVYGAGFKEAYWLALLAAVVTGLVMARVQRERPRRAAKLPMEGSLFLFVLALALLEPLGKLYSNAAEGRPIFNFGISAAGDVFSFPPPDSPLIYLPPFLQLLLTLFGVYAAAYGVMQVTVSGPGRYIREQSLFIRLIRWLKEELRGLYAWITDIDLTEPGDRTVIKMLAVNFLILAVLCCMWFFGIIVLAIYTVILFFALRKYTRKLKRQYGSLLRVTGEMAAGRLNVEIDPDLGVFYPLGEELRKVQTGFRRAVENEVRSQSMRTELITNVSHDLKTPLTAIITYIGLLKNEGITEQERGEYVDTLDRKSQRLKRLIDDLFEVSRVNSGNVTVNLMPVHLPALIRQVELEIADEIKASGITFLYRFPEEKTPLRLDGEKTSRIFENLLINVTKYGMPGTRAYIDMTENERQAIVEVKNISKEPLDFGTADITERFVRGDRSRGTEGSGLGLGIAKSFAELQGGRLTVATDGDLFKAIVIFPLSCAEPEPDII